MPGLNPQVASPRSWSRGPQRSTCRRAAPERGREGTRWSGRPGRRRTRSHPRPTCECCTPSASRPAPGTGIAATPANWPSETRVSDPSPGALASSGCSLSSSLRRLQLFARPLRHLGLPVPPNLLCLVSPPCAPAHREYDLHGAGRQAWNVSRSEYESKCPPHTNRFRFPNGAVQRKINTNNKGNNCTRDRTVPQEKQHQIVFHPKPKSVSS